MEVAKIIYPDYKNSKGGIIMRKFLSGIVVGVIIVSGCLAVDSVITKTSHREATADRRFITVVRVHRITGRII